MMETFDWIMLVVFILIIVICCIKLFRGCLICPQERESIIVERLGQYSKTLGAGINCIVPVLDRTKVISVNYLIAEGDDSVHLVKRSTHIITTQNGVMDFPMQYD